MAVGPAAKAACPEGLLPVEAAPERPDSPAESYCLDRTEVTVSSYSACVEDGVCEPAGNRVTAAGMGSRDHDLFSAACNAEREGAHGHPINCLRFEQAERYCEWKGLRLPTAVEWQWAAQGGAEKRPFPWGALPPDRTRLNACGVECLEWVQARGRRWSLMHYGDDGWSTTGVVGFYPAGAGRWGHLDLAGNVWELTSTPIEEGGEPPASRVIRGGGWPQTAQERVTTSYRGGFREADQGSAIGFRCAGSLEPSSLPTSSSEADVPVP